MEKSDLALIEQYKTGDGALAKLYQEHIDFERQLDRYNRKPFLTAEEEMERKALQKRKLIGRDHIEMILTKYRSQGGR